MLLPVTAIVSSQPLHRDLPFDIARDFDPVGMLGVGAYLLVVPNESPTKSVKWKKVIATAGIKPE